MPEDRWRSHLPFVAGVLDGLRRGSPMARALGWAVAAGVIFSLLNASLRMLAMELHPFQAQFLRYLFGLVVMLPMILRSGLAQYRPNGLGGQLWRGVVHTGGLLLWFFALPHVPLADMTALGFTGPIFVMIGAVWMLGERMVWERWVAALIGFVGVLIVVGPKLSGAGGYYNLVMLAAAPMFAASFLITKALTRRDSASVIVVWQALTVSVFTLPLAWLHWSPPTAMQWVGSLVCGMLGSAAHYCLTRSYKNVDISSTQSVKFLDLIWSATLGFLVFGDVPSQSSIVGGLVVLASTVWIARREAGRAPPSGR
jgi:drug/metabolite transporter (DMT)-like permease